MPIIFAQDFYNFVLLEMIKFMYCVDQTDKWDYVN